MSERLTKKQFIEKSIAVHGDKYDYSKTVYKTAKDKVCIICPEHGEFWQTPQSHLLGHGCSKCVGTGKLTTEEFIEKAMTIHGDKYDYSKVNYVNAKTKICIICPEHGEFWQIPNNHLNGSGCPKCVGIGLLQEEVIERFRSTHGDRYDYSKVVFSKMRDKVCIICPEHGEFWQTPNAHINGNGCPLCAHEETWNKRGRITTDEFVQKAKEVHGSRYDYSKVNYINNRKKVCILCNKLDRNGLVHGEFWQNPNCHLSGNGCPKCRNSSLEEKVMVFLEKNGIRYVKEQTFWWLIDKQNMYLDFYLPDYNIAIECQGIQHFIPIKRGKMTQDSSECLFEEIKKRDALKLKLCSEHNIKVLYFTNKSIVEKWNGGLFEDIFYEEDKIMKQILE